MFEVLGVHAHGRIGLYQAVETVVGMVGGEARIADGELRQAVLVVVAERRNRRVAAAPALSHLRNVAVPVVGYGGGEGAPRVLDGRKAAHGVVRCRIMIHPS